MAILALGAVARFWGLRFGLPHTYARPDETIIIDVALQFLRGNYLPTFHDYGWVYMWAISGLYLLYYVWGQMTGAFSSVADVVASWRHDWVPFFVMNRALSATMGTLTILLVFRLARRIWDETTALVAALFMALAFLAARDSHYGTTDTLMTFLIVLSVSILMRAHVTRRRRQFMIAGLAAGLATGTKYNAALLIAPIVMSYVLNIIESADRRKALFDTRLVAFFLPFGVGLFIGAPFLLLDTERFLGEMRLLTDTMEKGIGEGDLNSGWIHHLQYSLRYGVGLPMLLAGLAGMGLMLAFEPRTGPLLLAFPFTYYVVAGGVKNQFFRYMIPVVPFVCLAAARFVTQLASYVGAGFSRPDRPSVRAGFSRTSTSSIRLIIAALAILIVLPSAISIYRFDRIMARTDNRVVVARWFDKHVPAGSAVLLSGSQYGYIQTTRSMGYRAWVWDKNRLAFVSDREKKPMTGRPQWILVQDSPLPSETQREVTELLEDGYVDVMDFVAFSPGVDRVYDSQDAFFVPYAGFEGVLRPGPNYRLHKRIGEE